MGRKTIPTKIKTSYVLEFMENPSSSLELDFNNRHEIYILFSIEYLKRGQQIVHITYCQIVKGNPHYRPSIYTQMGLKLRFMMDKLKGHSMVKHLAPLSAQN